MKAQTQATQRVKGSLVGRVRGSDAFIAVVTDGSRAVAYLCDGKFVGQRFEGTVERGRIELASRDGERLVATLTPGAVRGSVRLARGKPLAFRAVRAKGPAGYYRAARKVGGSTVTAGWVVLANGDQRGTCTGLLGDRRVIEGCGNPGEEAEVVDPCAAAADQRVTILLAQCAKQNLAEQQAAPRAQGAQPGRRPTSGARATTAAPQLRVEQVTERTGDGTASPPAPSFEVVEEVDPGEVQDPAPGPVEEGVG